jgi:hypothetical protein
MQHAAMFPVIILPAFHILNREVINAPLLTYAIALGLAIERCERNQRTWQGVE